MKSILYVGATLMIGASIYGFVDYKKTSHKKEFTGMYQANKEPAPVAIPEKKENIIVEKNGIMVSPVEKINPGEGTGNTTTVKESSPGVKQKITRRKRLNSRLFSRAPLDERYLEKKSSGLLPIKEK